MEVAGTDATRPVAIINYRRHIEFTDHKALRLSSSITIKYPTKCIRNIQR
jgi:hypothetical protein